MEDPAGDGGRYITCRHRCRGILARVGLLAGRLSRWSCWITTYSGQEHQFSSKRVFCEFFALFYSFYTCRRRRLAVLVLGLLAGAVVVCLRERSVDVTLVQRDALWRRWRTRPATAGGTLHAGIGVVAFSHGLASLQVVCQGGLVGSRLTRDRSINFLQREFFALFCEFFALFYSFLVVGLLAVRSSRASVNARSK